MAHDSFEQFVKYLVAEKHIQDPDVLLFKGVFDNDTGLVEKAIQAGANVNVTDAEIIRKYSKFHEEFKKQSGASMVHGEMEKQPGASKTRDDMFSRFIQYLTEVAKIQDDPDLLVFKGVFDNDTKIIEKAVSLGANVNVTDHEIIDRYSNFFEDFLVSLKNEKKDLFPDLVYYLRVIKQVRDPDVVLWESVYGGNKEKLEKAVSDGANVNVTDTEIIRRYSSLLNDFFKIYKKKHEVIENLKKVPRLQENLFPRFVFYLTVLKQVKDADVVQLDSMLDENKERFETAVKNGVSVKDAAAKIIHRYSDCLEEFFKFCKVLHEPLLYYLIYSRDFSEEQKDLFKKDLFPRFISFLADEKKVSDPDVLFWKSGLLDGNIENQRKALDSGANINGFDDEIIRRFSQNLEEFFLRLIGASR